MMKLGEERKNTRFFILPKRLKVKGTDKKEWRIGRQEVIEYCTLSAVPDLHPNLWPYICIPIQWANERKGKDET